jgi:inosine-uridine nucleoside N-ribohydrolase
MRRRFRPAAVLFALALIASACGTGSGEPTTTPAGDDIPLIIDGDFGPDDMMALLYLSQEPGLALEAVTVTGTGLAHCPEGADNAAAVLAYLGDEEVPVACGETATLGGDNAFPEEWRLGADGLADQLGLPASEVAAGDDAVGLIVDTITRSADPIRLLALGPLTNLARALEVSPGIVDNIEHLVIMGGAVDVPGSVAPSMTAEWNIWVDPQAASAVIASGIPITLVALDATNDVPATRFFYETLEAQREAPAAALLYRYLEANQGIFEGGSYFFWDPLAAVTLVHPDVVETERKPIIVVENQGHDEGATVESADGIEIDVAVAADRSRFETFFLTALNGGTPVEANIPEPDLSVRFDGDQCTFEGTTSFQEGEVTTRVIVELLNESELAFSVVSGLHEGYSWDRLVYDAARIETQGPPDYWEPTGEVTILAESLTGGRVTGPLDLAPGGHALACAISDSRVTLLTDIVVEG